MLTYVVYLTVISLKSELIIVSGIDIREHKNSSPITRCMLILEFLYIYTYIYTSNPKLTKSVRHKTQHMQGIGFNESVCLCVCEYVHVYACTIKLGLCKACTV